MKHLFTLKAGLLGKLLLAAALIIFGGDNVWADTVILSGSTYNSTDWGTGSICSTSNKVSVPGETDISTTGAFQSKSDYLEGYKYSWYAFYSNKTIAISSGQKIVISAQGMGSTSAKLCVRISSTSKNDNSTYSAAATFTEEIQSSTLQDGFTDLVVSDIASGSYYIQIVSKAVNINRITIQDSEGPVLSASPNEDADFGEVYYGAYKVYSITNNGGSDISVTPSISGTNASEFSVSPSEATSIAAGESQNFTLTFNYDSSSLGYKTATLTFTPSDNEYNTLSYDVTATSIDNNAPELSVTPNDTAAFGTVRANATKTYTITNAGTGNMIANIASDNDTEFSVSKSTVET